MSEILFNLKNTVLIIVVSEFLKNFMSSKKYKKYISISVNLLVVSYLFFQLSGLDFDVQSFDSESYTSEYENKVITEYEKNVSESLMEEYRKNGIFSVFDVITRVDEQYNIISLEIYVNTNSEAKESDTKKIIAVTEGAGIDNYEIIKTAY